MELSCNNKDNLWTGIAMFLDERSYIFLILYNPYELYNNSSTTTEMLSSSWVILLLLDLQYYNTGFKKRPRSELVPAHEIPKY